MEEERTGKREREKPCDMETRRAKPTEQSCRRETYHVQMESVCREIEQEFAVLSTHDTPKLVHVTFFESPTFVNQY